MARRQRRKRPSFSRKMKRTGYVKLTRGGTRF